MFSGSNTNSSGFNSVKQFVNFASSQNAVMPPSNSIQFTGLSQNSGSIDWAHLAQQWIQMRDNSEAPSMQHHIQYNPTPIAPPAPIINDLPVYNEAKQTAKYRVKYEEKGEADMEMDEEISFEHLTERQKMTNTSLPKVAVFMQQQWYSDCRVPSSEESRNVIQSQWTAWQSRCEKPLPPVLPTQNIGRINANTNPTAHIPSLLKLNVTNPNEIPPINNVNINASSNSMVSCAINNGIDANKRKMLPAWIREGLEKMEREKQKHIEREFNQTGVNAISNNLKQSAKIYEQTAVNSLYNTNLADDITSCNEATTEDAIEQMQYKKLQRSQLHMETETFEEVCTIDAVYGNKEDDDKGGDNEDGQLVTIVQTQKVQPEKIQKIGKPYKQKLEMMSIVRRTLTELLLETTNEEISKVAQEAIKYQRIKASSAQVIRKSALSSITGKLGLAAYVDSSSDESSIESDNEHTKSEKDKCDVDSEEELKTVIRNKHCAFAKTIEEIEECIALSEQREEQKLQQKQIEEAQVNVTSAPLTKSSTLTTEKTGKKSMPVVGQPKSTLYKHKIYKHDFGETASDKALQNFNGKRLTRKERTTRFSDNKDGKGAVITAAPVTAASTSYLNKLPQTNIIAVAASPTLQPLTSLTKSFLQMPTTIVQNKSDCNYLIDTADATVKMTINSKRKPKCKKLECSERRERRQHHRHENNRKSKSSDEKSSTKDSDDSDEGSSSHTNSGNSSNSSSTDNSNSSISNNNCKASRNSKRTSYQWLHKQSNRHNDTRSQHNSKIHHSIIGIKDRNIHSRINKNNSNKYSRKRDLSKSNESKYVRALESKSTTSSRKPYEHQERRCFSDEDSDDYNKSSKMRYKQRYTKYDTKQRTRIRSRSRCSSQRAHH